MIALLGILAVLGAALLLVVAVIIAFNVIRNGGSYPKGESPPE